VGKREATSFAFYEWVSHPWVHIRVESWLFETDLSFKLRSVKLISAYKTLAKLLELILRNKSKPVFK
jgi:hypothetical protein